MDIAYSGLDWLYKELKKKRIALSRAEEKGGYNSEEAANIRQKIEVIEWLIGLALKEE